MTIYRLDCGHDYITTTAVRRHAFCRRCQSSQSVAPRGFWWRCLTCNCTRTSGARGESSARTLATSHLLRKHHAVELLHDDEHVETFKLDAQLQFDNDPPF